MISNDLQKLSRFSMNLSLYKIVDQKIVVLQTKTNKPKKPRKGGKRKKKSGL